MMSVEPGFGGQKFIPETMDRLRELRAMINKSKKQPLLEVDGGITLQNVADVLEAGADTIVAGSAVFRGDVTAQVKAFQKILSSAR